MSHTRHAYLMIGLLAVGVALFLRGSVGDVLLFALWPLACVAMMFWMMRASGAMGGVGQRADHGAAQSPDEAPTAGRT